MEFGNCLETGGQAVAYKNDVELASVGAFSTAIKVEFEYHDGDVIKISELNMAIIQFNDLEIVECTGSIVMGGEPLFFRLRAGSSIPFFNSLKAFGEFLFLLFDFWTENFPI